MRSKRCIDVARMMREYIEMKEKKYNIGKIKKAERERKKTERERERAGVIGKLSELPYSRIV